jgi:two-component system, LytTR family, response regulator
MQTFTRKLSDEEKYVILSSSGKQLFVRQCEIIYLQSDNCYTRIYLADNLRYLICKTLKNFEGELDSRIFLRCHKSFLVNRFFIKEIIRRKDTCIVMTNGDIIPVSRRKHRELTFLLRMYINKTVTLVKHTVP